MKEQTIESTVSKSQKPICDTCKSEIEFLPYRLVVLKDKNRIPIIARFHYFFPCWDLDLLKQRYDDCELVDAGFCFNYKEIKQNIDQMRNWKNNSELWS